ncbi:MAG: YgjV family protein [Clostridia bacterium]|nr:YgjV family protein [Clostridia bacterium]
MDLSFKYILSQLFSIISYILIGTTYYVKERSTLLIISFFQTIFLGIGYYFLGQYQGMLMLTVGVITSIIIFIEEKKCGKKEHIEKRDIIILISILLYAVFLAIVTYTEILSLFSVFATIVWVISVWVKDIKVYKFIGIITCVLWLVFNIYAQSISGIVVECILLVTSISGYCLELKNK